MNTKRFDRAVFMSVIAGSAAIATCHAKSWATEQPRRVQSIAQYPVAQYTAAPTVPATATTETGCRQTNAMTGIYSQPSLDSSSRGLLNQGQTVQLELVGTGTGWARITAPVIGWVEAKYLTPAAACTGLSPISQVGQPIGPATTPNSTTPASLPTQPVVAKNVTVICEVLPIEGLVVRSQPSVTEGTPLYTLPKGSYQFQFTNHHVTTRSGDADRYWSYITAPYTGWISLGVTGGTLNLGGRECG